MKSDGFLRTNLLPRPPPPSSSMRPLSSAPVLLLTRLSSSSLLLCFLSFSSTSAPSLTPSTLLSPPRPPFTSSFSSPWLSSRLSSCGRPSGGPGRLGRQESEAAREGGEEGGGGGPGGGGGTRARAAERSAGMAGGVDQERWVGEEEERG